MSLFGALPEFLRQPQQDFYDPEVPSIPMPGTVYGQNLPPDFLRQPGLNFQQEHVPSQPTLSEGLLGGLAGAVKGLPIIPDIVMSLPQLGNEGLKGINEALNLPEPTLLDPAVDYINRGRGGIQQGFNELSNLIVPLEQQEQYQNQVRSGDFDVANVGNVAGAALPSLLASLMSGGRVAPMGGMMLSEAQGNLEGQDLSALDKLKYYGQTVPTNTLLERIGINPFLKKGVGSALNKPVQEATTEVAQGLNSLYFNPTDEPKDYMGEARIGAVGGLGAGGTVAAGQAAGQGTADLIDATDAGVLQNVEQGMSRNAPTLENQKSVTEAVGNDAIVVQNPSQMAPEDLQAVQAGAAAQSVDLGGVEGVRVNGKTYVFTDTVTEPGRAQQVAGHENIGHAGIQQIAADANIEVADVLQGIADARSAEIAEWGANSAYADAGANVIVEEYVANLAEDAVRTGKIDSVLNKLIVKLRNGLKKIGYQGKEWSNREVLELLRDSRRANQGQQTQQDPRMSMAGEFAKTADKAALENAKAQYYDGVEPEQIRQDTGWHIGKDGNWRFEIDDSQAAFKTPEQTESKYTPGKMHPPSVTGKTLGDVLDHPELFEAYPGLKNLNLRDIDPQDKGRLHGYLSPGGFGEGEHMGIETDPEYTREGKPLKTALHESQHYIQNQEGFAKGSSVEREVPTARTTKENARREEVHHGVAGYIKRHQEKDENFNEEDVRNRVANLYPTVPMGDIKAMMTAVKSGKVKDSSSVLLKKAIAARDKGEKLGDPVERYLRQLGELEARDTEARSEMTPEQRKETPPLSSEPELSKDPLMRFSVPKTKDGKKFAKGAYLADEKGDMLELYHGSVGALPEKLEPGKPLYVTPSGHYASYYAASEATGSPLSYNPSEHVAIQDLEDADIADLEKQLEELEKDLTSDESRYDGSKVKAMIPGKLWDAMEFVGDTLDKEGNWDEKKLLDQTGTIARAVGEGKFGETGMTGNQVNDMILDYSEAQLPADVRERRRKEDKYMYLTHQLGYANRASSVVHKLYSNIKNPYIVPDENESFIYDLSESPETIEKLKAKGYDSAIWMDGQGLNPKSSKEEVMEGLKDSAGRPYGAEILIFDPQDSVRDSTGARFSAGFASPNEAEAVDYKTAVKDIQTPAHQEFHDFSDKVDTALGLKHETVDGIGDWATGAESTVMTEYDDSVSLEEMAVAQALKGVKANQMATIAFKDDPDGPQSSYELDLPHGIEATRNLLDKHGIEFRTLVPKSSGTRAIMVDLEGTDIDLFHAIEQLANKEGIEYGHQQGYAEFLGDWEDRAAGKAAQTDRIIKALQDGQGEKFRDLAESVIGKQPEVRFAISKKNQNAFDKWLAKVPGQVQQGQTEFTIPEGMPKGAIPDFKRELTPYFEDVDNVDGKLVGTYAKRPSDKFNRKKRVEHLETSGIIEKTDVPKVPYTGEKVTKKDIAKWVDNNVRDNGYYIHPEDRSPAALQAISDIFAAEANHAKDQDDSAIGWYDANVRKAMGNMEKIHPELKTDPQAQFIFKMFLAVHSQGISVMENFEYADEAYKGYKKTGKLPTKSTGKSKNAIKHNIELMQDLIDEKGLAEVLEFFERPTTAGELKKLGLPVSGELLTAKGRGNMMLGAKIGSFFGNLYGHFDTVTMDLWWSRTFNRYTGNMMRFSEKRKDNSLKVMRETIKEDKKAAEHYGLSETSTDEEIIDKVPRIHSDYALSSSEDGTGTFADKTPFNKAAKGLDLVMNDLQDTPRNGEEREWMRKVVDKAKEKLDFEITNADLQALLWYHEKRLFENMGGGSQSMAPADYEMASRRLMTRFYPKIAGKHKITYDEPEKKGKK